MSFLGKVWKQEKTENFDEFIKAIGVPEEYKDKLLGHSPKTKMEKDGDTYTYTTTYGDKEKKVSFKSGEEFEEEVSSGISLKTTVTVVGDVITHVQTIPGGKVITQKREFSGDKVKVTLTVDGWSGAAYVHLVSE